MPSKFIYNCSFEHNHQEAEGWITRVWGRIVVE